MNTTDKTIEEEAYRIRCRLGNNIKRYRMKAGLTQDELAELLELEYPATISRLESGRHWIRLYNLVKMAMVLHCTVDDLLIGDQPYQDNYKQYNRFLEVKSSIRKMLELLDDELS